MSEDGALAHISLALLRSELNRRQGTTDAPACGSDQASGHYNTPLHVFALFLILLLSTFACSFPLLVRRFPKLPVPNYSLFLSRHFGTGVLIATAFVHLLPTAYVSLTDPCLPRFWNEVYPPMSGFIAMVSVLVVVSIEMFFATKGAGHSHGMSDFEALREERDDVGPDEPRRSGSFKRFRQGPIGALQQEEEEVQVEVQVPLQVRQSPYSDRPGSVDKPLPPPPPVDEDGEEEGEHSDLDLDELEAEGDSARLLNGQRTHKPINPSANHHNNRTRDRPSRSVSFAEPLPTYDAHSHRLVLQCLLLEAGILFHSIFIGMALSVSTGPPFVVLLIAISFHQTFEGLALGSRIAAIPSFSTTSFKPWLMSFLYGVTTPVGQAIGLAMHSLYDPASQFGLLMVGCVNAVSAGLLLYAGLVQLLAEDFLSDASYRELRGRRRLEACAAVVLGSMLMAFVGAFA